MKMAWVQINKLWCTRTPVGFWPGTRFNAKSKWFHWLNNSRKLAEIDRAHKFRHKLTILYQSQYCSK